MADEKLNTGPGEEKLPEAPAPVTADGPQAPASEQTAAPTPQHEGPAQPEPGDVMVSFDKINELMNEKRQTARAEVEKEEAAKEPEEKTQEEPPAAGDDEPKKARRGRLPKRKKRRLLARRRRSPARAAHPRRIRRPPARPRRLSERNCPEVGKRLRRLKPPRNPKRPHPKMRLRPRNRLRRSQPLRPVLWRKESWSI